MATELTIGEFARRAGLSAKALRLYEERGFLLPTRVDAVSGYRYYDLGQLGRARTVALLRRLDLPLAEVADVLELPTSQIEPWLRDWWTARRQHLDDRHGTLELVIRALAPSTALPAAQVERFEPATVEVVSLPASTVATIRREVTQDDLVDTFIADALEIRHHLDASAVEFDERFWVEYHAAVGPGIAAPIETCVPYDGLVAPTGDIVLRAEPPHQAAAVELRAADCVYPQIMAIYAALEAWVEAHPVEPSAPVREIYTETWCTDGAVGRLAQPIAFA